MIKVLIYKDGEEFTQFEHYSPESISKMFENAMVEIYRQYEKESYIPRKQLRDMRNALDMALEGDHL